MELLTVHEAAKLLKVNPITVRRFIAQGHLAAVRVGRAIRVSSEALDEFLTPVQPEPAKRAKRPRAGRPITADDPLWNIVGIASTAEPTDASKIHEYLADAYDPHKS